jgi:hypothetical protein
MHVESFCDFPYFPYIKNECPGRMKLRIMKKPAILYSSIATDVWHKMEIGLELY